MKYILERQSTDKRKTRPQSEIHRTHQSSISNNSNSKEIELLTTNYSSERLVIDKTEAEEA